jgi:hypothetical protein
MRIAAGVLLILVSVVHCCTGTGMMVAGSCSATVGRGIETIGGSSSKEAALASRELEKAGAVMMAVGGMMLALVGLQIAGAVQLFRNKSAMFVLIVGVVGIFIELVSLALWIWSEQHSRAEERGPGGYIVIAFGVLASAFAIAASRSIEPEGPPPGAT